MSPFLYLPHILVETVEKRVSKGQEEGRASRQSGDAKLSFHREGSSCPHLTLLNRPLLNYFLNYSVFLVSNGFQL